MRKEIDWIKVIVWIVALAFCGACWWGIVELIKWLVCVW